MYQPSNMASGNILAAYQEKIDYQLMQSENCVITRVREIPKEQPRMDNHIEHTVPEQKTKTNKTRKLKEYICL